MSMTHTDNSEIKGHSATVALSLHINGRTFSLADVGPDDAMLRIPSQVQGGLGELQIVVDGRIHRRSVLVAATVGIDRRVTYRSV